MCGPEYYSVIKSSLASTTCLRVDYKQQSSLAATSTVDITPTSTDCAIMHFARDRRAPWFSSLARQASTQSLSSGDLHRRPSTLLPPPSRRNRRQLHHIYTPLSISLSFSAYLLRNACPRSCSVQNWWRFSDDFRALSLAVFAMKFVKFMSTIYRAVMRFQNVRKNVSVTPCSRLVTAALQQCCGDRQGIIVATQTLEDRKTLWQWLIIIIIYYYLFDKHKAAHTSNNKTVHKTLM